MNEMSKIHISSSNLDLIMVNIEKLRQKNRESFRSEILSWMKNQNLSIAEWNDDFIRNLYEVFNEYY